jgi:hypothetical protein
VVAFTFNISWDGMGYGMESREEAVETGSMQSRCRSLQLLSDVDVGWRMWRSVSLFLCVQGEILRLGLKVSHGVFALHGRRLPGLSIHGTR